MGILVTFVNRSNGTEGKVAEKLRTARGVNEPSKTLDKKILRRIAEEFFTCVGVGFMEIFTAITAKALSGHGVAVLVAKNAA